MTQADATARPYHHGDLRLALIEAAEAWMRARSSWGFTLRELARELGVSHNAPYKHFPDKTALLVGVGERAFRRLGERLTTTMSAVDPDDSLAMIEAAAVAYVGFAVDEPAAFRLMFGEELANCTQPDFRQAADTAYAAITEAVTRGVSEGELRADVSATHAATAWALVHGLGFLLIDGRLQPDKVGTTPEALTRIVARTLIEGLRATRH